MSITYDEAISQLTSQGKFYINLGLERISAILNLLGNPQDKLKCIHVAGTNGKGSVCAMTSSVLAQKYKVGLFTSPHIFEYTERIQINGKQISKENFANLLERILNLADQNEIHLTEFEILTAMAFCYFAEQNVDFVVMEVGLGGRLDSTNVIKNPLCSVITHIDLDHTERLGKTIEEIASEKAGIIKNNCPVVVSENNLGLPVIEKVTRQNHAKLIKTKTLETLPDMALKGEFQKENLSLVLKVLDVLNLELSQENIQTGLKSTKHPCRFEYIKEKNLIIDGSHNPNGTVLLRKSLEENFPNQNYKFIFGCLRNKDYPQMVKNLFQAGDEIYFKHFNHSNSTKIEEVQEVCTYTLKPFKDFRFDDRLTVICGSFYMIKEVLDELGIKKYEN